MGLSWGKKHVSGAGACEVLIRRGSFDVCLGVPLLYHVRVVRIFADRPVSVLGSIVVCSSTVPQ